MNYNPTPKHSDIGNHLSITHHTSIFFRDVSSDNAARSSSTFYLFATGATSSISSKEMATKDLRAVGEGQKKRKLRASGVDN